VDSDIVESVAGMMPHWYTLLCLASLLLIQSQSKRVSSFDRRNECGLNTAPPKNSRMSNMKITNIVGGRETAKHGWPWQALIFRDRSYDPYYRGRGYFKVMFKQHCGGTIISPQFVLTAAHCVFDGDNGRRLEGEELEIYVGRHHMNESEAGSQTLRVEKIISHEGYKWPDIRDDIALIKVKPAIIMSRTVRAACLPRNDPTVGQVCVVTGWGMTATTRSSEYLQEVFMPIVDQPYCARTYKNRIDADLVITNTQICSGSTGKDSCVGDSGGPLACRKGSIWTLNGVVSAGPTNCATKGIPGIYTRVTSYTKWIADKSGVKVH